MDSLTVEVPHDPTPEELQAAADKADRVAAHHAAEARRFQDLAAYLRKRAVSLRG